MDLNANMKTEQKGSGKMAETRTKTDFIGIRSKIEEKNRDGNIQVSIQVNKMQITDEEFVGIRHSVEEVTKKIDEMIEERSQEMVETGTEIEFLGICSTIKKKNRKGNIEAFINVNCMLITDEELAKLRSLLEELAKKIDEMIEG